MSKMGRFLQGQRYGIVALSGDPFVRPARARLIWANNTAQACENLGVPAILAGQTTGAPISFESSEGLSSMRRVISNLYNLEVSYQLTGIYGLPEKIEKVSEEEWARLYDIPRYVFPYCGVLHTRDPYLMRNALSKGISCVYEDHDEGHNLSFTELGKIAQTHHNLRVVVAITQAVRDRLIVNGVPEDKIVVLDSGFNQASLRRDGEMAVNLRRRLLRGWKHLIVYAGGLHQERGISHLLEAAEKLPNSRFIICGGSPVEQVFWQNEAQKRYLSNISFVGYLPQAEVLKLQQAACAVVMTRRHDERAEITSPLKFFEYLASGSAVIAANIPAVERLLQNDLALETYNPEQSEYLAGKLQMLIAKYPWKAQGYSQNSAYASNFTWEKRQEAVFDRLLHS